MTRTSIDRNSALTDVEKRRIVLVAEEIYSKYYTGNIAPEFRSVLTMIMILVQEPLAFFLYKKNGAVLSFSYQFNKHNHYKAEVKDILSGEISEQNTFRVFGSEYYLLILRVKYREGDVGRAYFLNIRDGDPVERAALIVDSLLSDKRLSDDVDFMAVLRESLLLFPSSDEEKQPDYNIANKEIDNNERKIMYSSLILSYDELFKDASKSHKVDIENAVVSRVYSKVKKRSEGLTHGKNLHKPAGTLLKKLPNFVLIGRDYCGFLDKECATYGYEYKRKIDYDYRAYFLVCPEQEADFRDYFESLQRFDINTFWKLSLERHMGFNKSDKSPIAILARSLDMYFRNRLIQSGGINEFVSILKKPFGYTVRSMADPIFSAGIMHFREPFTSSALVRCFAGEIITSEGSSSLCKYINGKMQPPADSKLKDLLDDVKRVVISHYLFLGMSPCNPISDDGPKSNRIMLSPVEIGGSVYAVTGFFSANTQGEKVWEKIFHLNRIHERVEREMRRWLENFYFGLVYKSFSLAIDELEKKARGKTGYSISLKDVDEAIRKRLQPLEYFTPYAHLVPEIQIGSASSKRDGVAGQIIYDGIILSESLLF
jgi:hypothetical protein